MIETVEIRLSYNLLPWQKEVKRDRHRFRVVGAGRRSGKSVLGCDDLTQGAAEIPGSVNWYVGPTYEAAKVKKFRENNARERILSPEEARRLIECAGPGIQPVLIVALNTGMRRGEILSLE